MKGKYYSPSCQLNNDDLLNSEYYGNTFKYPYSPKCIAKNKVNTRKFSPVIQN